MLIIALLKGVPARTTKVVTVGGVLKREEMDIVLNPHDLKAIEAADFVRRKVGGKTVALTMGPDIKLAPLMKPLYNAEVFGVDEACILSDRKMAGADTLATSYAVALGVRKVVERHTKPLDELIATIKAAGYSETVKNKARELYEQNLLPNGVFSELPALKGSLVERFVQGQLTADQAVELLEKEKSALSNFVVVCGIKTTDGETGSVGPQVAESLAEALSLDVPHLTYVEDFDIDTDGRAIEAERRIGRLVQRVELHCPCLLTIATEYRARGPDPKTQAEVRARNYRGKIPTPIKWTADDLGADPTKLGFAGSPTIVGPGVDVGKPPVQKKIGKSLVFKERVEKFQFNGADVGPFDRGDLADALPEPLLNEMKNRGAVVAFDLRMLQQEAFA
jgi:electron transfer flavoprotein beta subunit